MEVLSGSANLLMGVVYIGIGALIATDLERDIRRRGWSHFGVAWLLIMFTCGAHHLVHGTHLAAEGRVMGVLDLFSVGIGLPAGVTWSLLRIEAARGGRGDRFLRGTPTWLQCLAAIYAAVVGAVVASSVLVLLGGVGYTDPRLLPNIMLVALYVGIGVHLLRGQRRNRRAYGGWSTSGLSLMLIFPTCALMHAVYVVYAATGFFAPDQHGLWVDWAGVPAGVYFFWVVRGLENGTVVDWNERFEAIEDLAAEPQEALA